MAIDRLLVPLDGSEFSDRALSVAAGIAAPKAEVLLVRAVPTGKAHDAELGPAEAHLARSVQELAGRGLRARGVVRRGEAAAAILEAADEFDPDLMVLTTHGRTGEKRWIRGSVAERLLERGTRPLLLANPFALPGSRRFTRILAPLDGSSDAASILPLVADLARAHGSTVVILANVVEEASQRLEADKLLEHYRKTLEGIETRTIVALGHPASTILGTIDREECDLVALTTHGRGAAARWLYGATADVVLHNAPVATLVRRVSPGR